MRVWPKRLFELFELFVKHVSILGETVSQQSTEIGLFDKHAYVIEITPLISSED